VTPLNRYAVWFRWAVFVGILQDWLPAIPGIFFPNAVVTLIGLPALELPIWGAFAALALLLLSLVYIPGALDPYRYPPLALLTVLARVAGVVFFFFLYPGQLPPIFGYIDLTFAVVQGALLYLVWRARPGAGPQTVAVAGGRP
jgi:hypothetical protein